MSDESFSAEVKEALAWGELPSHPRNRYHKRFDLVAKALRSSQARIVALEAGLAPFAEFGKNAGQFSGKGDELYIEHAKVKAVLRRSDCTAAEALLKGEQRG